MKYIKQISTILYLPNTKPPFYNNSKDYLEWRILVSDGTHDTLVHEVDKELMENYAIKMHIQKIYAEEYLEKLKNE